MDAFTQILSGMRDETITVLWLVPALLLLLAAYLTLPLLRARRAQQRLSSVFASLGTEHLSDVVLEDGLDGLTYIDRIVATPKALLALTLVPHEGMIFGAEGTDQWTRVVGQRTYRFPNPVRANREAVITVKQHCRDVPVEGMVLFTGDCSFPKGRPDIVRLPAEITRPSESFQELSAPVRKTWENLKSVARRTALRNEYELEALRERYRPWRHIIVWVIVSLAGIWIAATGYMAMATR